MYDDVDLLYKLFFFTKCLKSQRQKPKQEKEKQKQQSFDPVIKIDCKVAVAVRIYLIISSYETLNYKNHFESFHFLRNIIECRNNFIPQM